MKPTHSEDRVSAKLGEGSARSFDLYSEITQQIIAMLDKGVVPWRSPILGQGGGGYPKNFDSKKPYRGVNVFLLAFTGFLQGYPSSYWLTFKQALEAGGNVKKGEKSTMVVFWKKHEIVDKDSGEKKQVPLCRYYRVFNVAQCEGISPPDAVAFTPTAFNPIDEAEKIVQGYVEGPTIEHGGTRAFYRPATDMIHIPEPSRFVSPAEFYGTLFHEMVHSTGAAKRLNRGFESEPKPFGSPDYCKEELVAELGASFLCGHAGIAPAVIENQAAYISGWLGRLKEDRKLIIQAAASGQRAADWIRGQRTWEGTEKEASDGMPDPLPEQEPS